MKSVDQAIYTKNYYLHTCLGSEEFKKFHGEKIHPEVKSLLTMISIKKGMKILDLGCGRGDVAFFLQKKGAIVTGIDYATAAVQIAKNTLGEKDKAVQRNISFYIMDAKKLKFENNIFDAVLALDVFEHLYKEELETALSEIYRVLKKQGILLVHTEVNKLYLDVMHKMYVYPVSTLLLFFNKLITRKEYPGLSNDPRSDVHKAQHVNEPTFFYLKRLFKRHFFAGKIISKIGLAKPILSWKDRIYNAIVLWYPLSKLAPFHYFFATDYICIMKKKV